MSSMVIQQTGWKQYNLIDFVDILDSKRIPLSKMERATRQGCYPYYGASGIVDYIDDYIFEGEHVLVSEDGENLRSRKTPIAFKASGKFWVNNHAHILKGKKNSYNDLIVYYLSNIDLNAYLSGAVQPKLSKGNLLSIPLYLPASEDEIHAIISILGGFDKKINLLRSQNETLEGMAQTLFRKWFIEDAPEHWEERRLLDIADHKKDSVHPSKSPDDTFFHYSIPAFDDGQNPVKELGSEIKSNKYKVISRSILISKLNPRFPRVWPVIEDVSENAICSTEFQVVLPKKEHYFGFIYCFLNSKIVSSELIGAAGGTSGSHQRVRPEDIFNLKLRMPPDDKILEFSELTITFWEKFLKNKSQITTLENLRDTILPKLLNGEIKAPCFNRSL